MEMYVNIFYGKEMNTITNMDLFQMRSYLLNTALLINY